MKKATCNHCGKEFSIGEMVSANEQVLLCIPCAEAALAGGGSLGKVTRLVDNTICGNCHEDWGRDELPPVAGIPMCRKCTEHFRHRPFPVWVKVAAAGLAVLVIFGMWRSLRFVDGYLAAKRAAAATKAGDLDRTHAEVALALEKVPESQEFQIAEPYLRGIILLRDDKDEEALAAFREAKLRAGRMLVEGLERLLLEAETGAAFYRKDYDAFLAKSQDQFRLKDDAMSNAGMASALACKYAITGDEDHKRQSLDALAKAKRLAVAEKMDLGDFVERIEYRLTSREIIDAKEYRKRFPKTEAKETPAAVTTAADTVDVILTSGGDRKIMAIKAVREVTGLGLKDAKDLVDGAPKPVRQGVPRKEAEEIKRKLEEAGASVELRQPSDTPAPLPAADTVDIILTAGGDRKILAIKAVREVTGLGLKDAKDLVEGAPKPVRQGVPRKEAEEIKRKLEEAGASVELRQPSDTPADRQRSAPAP